MAGDGVSWVGETVEKEGDVVVGRAVLFEYAEEDAVSFAFAIFLADDGSRVGT